jgi:predicted glutamine amidotransferase
MCRLFGLHAGRSVTATFWLLDAPDSLVSQSKRNPDGTGLGVFGPGGTPLVRKEPIAAWEDTAFACEAHEMKGTTFVAHVRYASTGDLDIRNTHPFLQDDRLFAHNGVVAGLDEVDARLRELSVGKLVLGQTDSERVFALITGEIRAHGGDVEAGLADAMTWLADNVPIYAVNVLLATATDMWALRYPETHELFVLERRPRATAFEMQSNRIHTRSQELDAQASVVFASEPMDDDEEWQPLEPGVVVHVDAGLSITRRELLPHRPKHQLALSDLSSREAASQHPTVPSG